MRTGAFSIEGLLAIPAGEAARLRALALELSLVEDRERKRLAADLQDDLGQVLTAIHAKLAFMLKSITHLLARPSPHRQAPDDAMIKQHFRAA